MLTSNLVVYQQKVFNVQNMTDGRYPRSNNDDTLVTINFTNNTSWNALLLWCDYDGNRVLYASIGAGRCCQVFSFLTHPWIGVDSKSFLPMTFNIITRDATVHNTSVFTPCEKFISSSDSGLISVSINHPIVSLMELCTRVVQITYSPEIIQRLALPHFLVNSLLQPVAVPWDRLATNRM